MNKKNIWILGLLATVLSGVLSSCDDDDDDNKLNYSDPRIRTMSIVGISNTFIVNDVEELIYNYDSLSFGTKLNALHPNFNGYQVKTPILYDSAGIWKTYPNDTTFKLDLSKGLKIRSLSVDSTCYKDYQIEIRVHKFDVESFEWEKIGNEIKHGSTNGNEKAVFLNGKYHYFFEDGQTSNYLTSKDASNWKLIGEYNYENKPLWSSLTAFNEKLYVSMGDSIFESTNDYADFQPCQMRIPDGYSKAKPLFVLGEKLWILAQKGETISLCYAGANDTTFTLGETITEPISFEEITSAVSASGSTNLGYIFSPEKDGNCVILSVDKSGIVIRPTQKSTFAYRNGMTVFYYENLICIMGGTNADGSYSNKTYSSTDSGITWSENSHRIMPGNGQFSHASALPDPDSNYIMLIGGNLGENSSIAWKGILKQFIMDDILYGKN